MFESVREERARRFEHVEVPEKILKTGKGATVYNRPTDF